MGNGSQLPFEMTSGMSGILENGPLICAGASFALSQVTKFVIHYCKHRVWDWHRLYGPGGMPSAHTALVTALAAAVAIKEGTSSTSFAICVVLAAITAYDATGVRLHAGRQAGVLNAIVAQLPPEHPVQDHIYAGRLREILGHTPLEVVGGAVLGLSVGCLIQGLLFSPQLVPS
mmetsp:Transcript_15069/g.32668  ORF Transcript_15069/g.32668 Transcript_15069/m.32668 type:complete len:174 (+) Transcript_15069:96-617(+)|eukprot:CAMPEP_0202896582 /NCGR_PEP_ID=MMETSP1392-20130828/5561_1 /ASSEMBLY_ACC=CAM_ASM_000868 /TAXON_ID=225041 /ORGANISM="Chlamydomonas chlamydogama, Strain SAG 11-48b" /LENGTH=173 /DNA_ID=CAMNT_0049581991 /DNA_START=97 /DNA_END=618 /DNA_ORIENTATION=-